MGIFTHFCPKIPDRTPPWPEGDTKGCRGTWRLYRDAMGANGWAHGGRGGGGRGIPGGFHVTLRNWELSMQSSSHRPPSRSKYFALFPYSVVFRYSTMLGTCDTLCLTGGHSRPELWLMPVPKM